MKKEEIASACRPRNDKGCTQCHCERGLADRGNLLKIATVAFGNLATLRGLLRPDGFAMA